MIVELLILQTIYVVNKEILQFLGPGYVIFLKTGWWNSNAQTSGIHRYLQFDQKVVFSWPQRSSNYIKSGRKTLYNRERVIMVSVWYIIKRGLATANLPQTWTTRLYVCDEHTLPTDMANLSAAKNKKKSPLSPYGPLGLIVMRKMCILLFCSHAFFAFYFVS